MSFCECARVAYLHQIPKYECISLKKHGLIEGHNKNYKSSPVDLPRKLCCSYPQEGPIMVK